MPLLGALLLAVTAAGCGREPTRPRDVLLITVDTLRADALGCYGRESARTPHIDALGAGGALFTRAFTPRAVTIPALSTIHTGVSPFSHGVLGQSEPLPAELPTLGEVLGGSGWSTAAFITNICEVIVSLPDHVGRGYATRDCLRDHEQPQHAWDSAATDSAVRWLDEVPADQPALLWVHYMDPHGEHRPRLDLVKGRLPPELAQGETTRIFQNHERDDIKPRGALMEGLWNLYDAEIAGVDVQVGRLLEAWRARRGAEGLVVFVADHGEELFDHDNFMGHGESMHDSALHVPLIISAPGLVAPGTVCDAIVELQDLAPTILDLLGQPAVATHEGVSLRTVLAPEGPSHALRAELEAAFASRWRDVITVRTSRWRYTWNLRFGEAEKDLIDELKYRARFAYFRNEEQLFDLQADPGATRNLLADAEPGTEAWRARDGLREEIARWLGTRRQPSGTRESSINEKLFEELKQLGYVDFVPEQYR